MSESSHHRLAAIVETTYGPVRGFVENGMQQYLGIPYASPPVNELRWRPPIAPRPWEEPYNAFKHGNICAQDSPGTPGFGHVAYAEDCLYLNIFTPDGRDHHDTREAKGLAVMVLIHGGGFTCGASNDYDPSRLVKEGNVIFVSFNYRLNIFGFFSHPAINAEDHLAGNYGVMDQQLALAWVQHNSAAFGGDPNNVTVFGESAGGACTMVHMVSPSSSGLLNKAIIQSGGSPPTMYFPSIEQLEKVGVEFASAAGCEEQTAEKLRSLPAKDIVITNRLPEDQFGVAKFPFGLMEDGEIVPKSMRSTFSSGRFSRIPVIIGVNRDEFAWFQASMELCSGKLISSDAYPQALSDTFNLLNALFLNGVIVPPDAIARVLQLYPADSHSSPSRALAAAVGDGGLISTAGRRTTRIIQKFNPDVYAYEFDVPDTPCPWPPVSFPYGSAHTLELPYIFPFFRGGSGKARTLSEPQERLASAMVRYWATFAWHGSPSGGTHFAGSDLPEWLAYNPTADNIMLLSAPACSMIDGWGERHNSDFWDSFYPSGS